MKKDRTPDDIPIPEPNVGTHEVELGTNQEEWTEEQVRFILCNPFVVGMGPFPSVIPDEQWIRCNARLIRDEGPEQFLVNLLAVLRDSFEES